MVTRLWRYIQTMFPVHRAFPVCLLSFVVTWCTATTVSGGELRFHPRLIAGAFSSVLFALLLRVMDEFKDYDLDRRLFPDRPIITGMVTVRDLTVLGWSTAVALFLLNVMLGPVIFGMFIVCFCYTLLMFKFFFWEKVRESLMYALVTHNPVVLLLQCYTISYLSPGTINPTLLAPVAVIFWLPWLTWEIARKIRAPESEDAYETYSRVFGYRGACAIVIVLVSLVFVGVLWVSRFYGGGPLLVAGIGAATCFVAYRVVRFVRAPVSGKAPLRLVLETYLMIFFAVFSAAQFLH